jgi:hypothetical protein
MDMSLRMVVGRSSLVVREFSRWQNGYTPTPVIFWNHRVSGRTWTKSLERNEL